MYDTQKGDLIRGKPYDQWHKEVMEGKLNEYANPSAWLSSTSRSRQRSVQGKIYRVNFKERYQIDISFLDGTKPEVGMLNIARFERL